jgi:hypothetical protein
MWLYGLHRCVRSLAVPSHSQMAVPSHSQMVVPSRSRMMACRVEGDRVQPPSHCGHPANSHVYRDRDTLIADRCQTKRIWDVAAQIRHVVDMSCLPSSTEDISLLASHIFGQGRCACKVRNRVPSYRWLFVACLGPRQELGSVV